MAWLIAVAVLILAVVLARGVWVYNLHQGCQALARRLSEKERQDAADAHWRGLYSLLQQLSDAITLQAAYSNQLLESHTEALHDWRDRQEALEAAIWHLAVNTQKDRPAQVMKLR